jgi:ATPase subunit of ABC transporter with duplicated ATPase domains
MLSTANITMQFGAKPLFENVSVKFGEGNRYGLIGANGCGKSTFMKILGGDLEPSSGNVMLDKGERLGKLRQDQFAYEDMRVLDVVMMGHTEMWDAMSERDTIYANPDASEEDYMRAADLEAAFAEYDGYTAEPRAGELLLGVGIAIELHNGPMREVARTLTYCCSTNRPTTSISTPSAGWKISSTHAIPPWSSSRMTVIS